MSARETSDCKTFVSICAYGRAASARSWARRSLAADTIFMARVIWRVLITLRMRRRISSMLAINQSLLVVRQNQTTLSLHGRPVPRVTEYLPPIPHLTLPDDQPFALEHDVFPVVADHP